MADTHLNEVPVANPVTSQQQERRLAVFNRFVRYKRSVIRENAEAYANKRARKMPYDVSGRNTFAEKIVVGATFVPAHPSRYEALGKGRGRKFKYFLIHRPGGPKTKTKPFKTLFPGEAGYDAAFAYAVRACSLKNTIYEFTHENRPAATHFIIGKSGELVQMVDLDDVAFHTRGRPHPYDRSLPRITNDNSVGVELEGPIFDSFTTVQLQRCAELIRMMADLYGISLEYDPERLYVLTHDEIDKSRKKDPWKNFPMNRVLQWAQSIQPYNVSALFQDPLDITDSTQVLVAEAKRDALTLESGLLKEVAIGAADSIDVEARASRKRAVTRDQLMQESTTFADTQEASLMEHTASLSKSETVNTEATVTPPSDGTSLFNWDTGGWEQSGG